MHCHAVNLVLLAGFAVTAAASPAGIRLEQLFASTVRPFLESHCFSCHGQEKQKGQLDLSPYTTMDAVAGDHRRWLIVLERLKAAEMPPEEAKRQPTPEARQAVVDWIEAMRKFEADQNAGDPGPVLARRLSNAEYDYTIRDLTGVDIRPTREFPIDPANEAGFDNSGESLTMSPALLKKYYEAAREVSEHIVLKPDGFVFAPHAMVAETDRDQYCVKRIVDFYQKQPTDYAAYFLAAWRFQFRAALGNPEATLGGVAAENGISARYLAAIWSALTGPEEMTGPLEALRVMWRALPAPGAGAETTAQRESERMRDFVIQIRAKLKPVVKNLSVRGISSGSQPLVLWKDRQFAAPRQRFRGVFPPDLATPAGQGNWGTPEARQLLALATDDTAREVTVNSLDRFCRIFPDAFYVSERGRIFLEDDKEDKGRLLSAGFHLMVGYYRDDRPLYDLILDEQQQRELDRLWQELNFITLAPLRQYKDFIFFERAEPPRFMQGAEFDFARSEDKDSTTDAKINQLSAAYLAKVRRATSNEAPIEAIEHYFQSIAEEIRTVERERLAAEPSHLKALEEFAQRAFRRPLLPAERSDLIAFYRTLRERDGLDHEDAIRDTVASILISPHFCYRFDLSHREIGAAGASPTSKRGETVPLSGHALASRLSYFLWSSMPDRDLLFHAASRDLNQRDVLKSQVRRMIQDPRIRALATEFGGNWLDFRRFEEHNAVDRGRFPSFNHELRAAMFEEPVRFLLEVMQMDRPVLDLLYGDYTFVNPVLARHYGIPGAQGSSNTWIRIDGAGRYERGGLLAMSVFLTKNSPGLRTSPVKRGYWVARRLLGESIPAPPPKVPELPNDEASLGGLTLRQTLAKHREDKSCATCHERFDSLGLVFEGYGPVGERRQADFAGRPVDTRASFPRGGEGAGLEGLRQYLRERRQEDFLDNLCRKMLSYALGRSVMLSDENLIHEMAAKLAASGRFSDLIERIVTSPQFLNKRSHDPK